MQMNKRIISLLLLFCILETFFIALTSFVCGYCAEYYFYELVRPRRRAEKGFFSVIIENMDSLTKALEKINLSEEFYFEDNLSNKQGFLEDAKKKVEEIFDSTNCSFYYGRKMMTFSVELYTLPSSEFSGKLLFNIDGILDVYFAKKRSYINRMVFKLFA